MFSLFIHLPKNDSEFQFPRKLLSVHGGVQHPKKNLLQLLLIWFGNHRFQVSSYWFIPCFPYQLGASYEGNQPQRSPKFGKSKAELGSIFLLHGNKHQEENLRNWCTVKLSSPWFCAQIPDHFVVPIYTTTFRTQQRCKCKRHVYTSGVPRNRPSIEIAKSLPY